MNEYSLNIIPLSEESLEKISTKVTLKDLVSKLKPELQGVYNLKILGHSQLLNILPPDFLNFWSNLTQSLELNGSRDKLVDVNAWPYIERIFQNYPPAIIEIIKVIEDLPETMKIRKDYEISNHSNLIKNGSAQSIKKEVLVENHIVNISDIEEEQPLTEITTPGGVIEKFFRNIKLTDITLPIVTTDISIIEQPSLYSMANLQKFNSSNLQLPDNLKNLEKIYVKFIKNMEELFNIYKELSSKVISTSDAVRSQRLISQNYTSKEQKRYA